jgi:hypothetical protein
MPNQKPVRLKPRDFQSLGEKLQHLHSTLPPGEARFFEFLLESALAAAGQKPPPPWINTHIPSKPHGSKRGIVAGGADGLTILVNRYGKFYVIEPEGPLPTERGADILGAIPIRGA